MRKAASPRRDKEDGYPSLAQHWDLSYEHGLRTQWHLFYHRLEIMRVKGCGHWEKLAICDTSLGQHAEIFAFLAERQREQGLKDGI